MIATILGKIISQEQNAITILTAGGVGYTISIKPNVIDNFVIGQQAQLLTYLSVSENAMNLYGFENKSELELFKNFLNVSGIGPKSALHLLSLGTVREIKTAISEGNVDYLTKVSGVGRKTAERIVVELRSKMEKDNLDDNIPGNNKNLSDVIDGLMAMGYSPQQAREAIKQINTENKTSEQLLKEALQMIN